MSEREIRSLLRSICDRLDARAAGVARKVVLPTMLGAGVALSAGCDEGQAVKVDAIIAPADAAYGDFRGLMDATPPDKLLPTYDAAYSAPLPDAIAADADKVDAGPQMDYLAPDAGPVPPYTAPDAGE